MTTLSSAMTQVPTLAALPQETQKKLERLAEQRAYRRRQIIHFPDQAGESVYLLCSGRVKISRISEQGREITLHLLEGPQLFGEAGLVGGPPPYELMAETLEDSQVAVFRRADLLAGLAESPQAALELFKVASERRAQAETLAADLIFLDVPRRLAKLLLRLHDQAGGKGARGGLLARTKFTHQELANMIGSTRETTTLVLNDFKRQGYLDFQGRRIVLRNRAVLEAMLLGSSEGRRAKP